MSPAQTPSATPAGTRAAAIGRSAEPDQRPAPDADGRARRRRRPGSASQQRLNSSQSSGNSKREPVEAVLHEDRALEALPCEPRLGRPRERGRHRSVMAFRTDRPSERALGARERGRPRADRPRTACAQGARQPLEAALGDVVAVLAVERLDMQRDRRRSWRRPGTTRAPARCRTRRSSRAVNVRPEDQEGPAGNVDGDAASASRPSAGATPA